MRTSIRLVAVFFTVLCHSLFAADGDPIAIRQWPDGGFSVESMWDLHVAVGLSDSTRKLLPRKPDAELESLPVMIGTAAKLSRAANEERPTLGPSPDKPVPHQISLVLSKNYETKPHLDARPLLSSTYVVADGLQIQFLDHDRVSMDDRKLQISRVQRPGPAFVAVATGSQFTAEFCAEYARTFQPSLMIVNRSIDEIDGKKVEKIPHNTVAASAIVQQKSKDPETKPRLTRFVSLGTKPYKMTDEVAELFEKKEAASAASRDRKSVV